MSEAEEKKCPSGKSCSDCGGHCNDGKQKIHANLLGVKRILLVMSGKGGVGKSTVSTNLAMSLACAGHSVGLLDVDFHGPSVPKMLNLEGAPLLGEEEQILPVEIGNLEVMSIGFTLPDQDHAVIWRGPMKYGVIQQLLSDVKWGALDYLIIDAPPGTGDEPLSVCQLLPTAEAVVVTTPQKVAATDVSKSLNFCRQLDFKVAGIIENMSGFVCPHCGTVTEIFSHGAGETLAEQYGVPFLGKLPIDPAVCEAGDAGDPVVHRLPDSALAKAFREVLSALS